MGDYWFAAGLLLAVFGPLLFIVPVAACYVLFRRFGLARRCGITRRGTQQAAHLLAALVVVAAVVAATWLPGRLEFARLCSALAEPRIHAELDARRAGRLEIDANDAMVIGCRLVGRQGFVRPGGGRLGGSAQARGSGAATRAPPPRGARAGGARARAHRRHALRGRGLARRGARSRVDRGARASPARAHRHARVRQITSWH